MNRRLACLALAGLAASACADRPLVRVAPEPAGHAWWLRASFDPRGRALRGVPVRALHPRWCAVDELGPAAFADLERADGGDAWARSAPRYSVPGPEVDGRATRVQLVVFRECAGATGTAMLLLDDAATSGGRPVAVQVLARPAAYAMLDSDAPARVHVVHCQDCDAIDTYRWDGGMRAWVEEPELTGDEP